MVTSLCKWSILFCFFSMVTAFSPGELSGSKDEKNLHPFYVSVTEINHNSGTGSVEISCKMFTDDFETALKNQYKLKIDLAQPQDKQQLEKLMAEYLQKHLQIKVNGKATALTFVGYEIESESAWCYLEGKQTTGIKSLDITNDLLYESFSSQISIIHAVVAGSRKSTKIVNPEKHVALQF